MKHIKLFLENKETLFTEISEEDFRKKTCRSTGGEKYDEYGVFKKEELFSQEVLEEILAKGSNCFFNRKDLEVISTELLKNDTYFRLSTR